MSSHSAAPATKPAQQTPDPESLLHDLAQLPWGLQKQLRELDQELSRARHAVQLLEQRREFLAAKISKVAAALAADAVRRAVEAEIWDGELLPLLRKCKGSWEAFRRTGATDEQILGRLKAGWPRYAYGGGTRCEGGQAARAWIGRLLDSPYQSAPTLEGKALATEARRLLEIPTPAEAQRRALEQARAKAAGGGGGAAKKPPAKKKRPAPKAKAAAGKGAGAADGKPLAQDKARPATPAATGADADTAYRQWLGKVNADKSAKLNLRPGREDTRWRNWFDLGKTPREAVRLWQMVDKGEAKYGGAEPAAAGAPKWDFVKTFPEPLAAERQHMLDEYLADEWDQDLADEYHGQRVGELTEVLRDMAEAEQALATDTDPTSGVQLSLGEREGYEADLRRFKTALNDHLQAYEDQFGAEAAKALEAHARAKVTPPPLLDAAKASAAAKAAIAAGDPDPISKGLAAGTRRPVSLNQAWVSKVDPALLKRLGQWMEANPGLVGGDDDAPEISLNPEYWMTFETSLGGQLMIKSCRNGGPVLAKSAMGKATVEALIKKVLNTGQSADAGASDRQNDIDAELTVALHRIEGAETRWNDLRRRGASNDELREAIGREFGISGSSSGPGRTGECHRGGTRPAFWLGNSQKGKPTLEGAALVEAVRRVMRVPVPTAVASRPSLFEAAGNAAAARQQQGDPPQSPKQKQTFGRWLASVRDAIAKGGQEPFEVDPTDAHVRECYAEGTRPKDAAVQLRTRRTFPPPATAPAAKGPKASGAPPEGAAAVPAHVAAQSIDWTTATGGGGGRAVHA